MMTVPEGMGLDRLAQALDQGTLGDETDALIHENVPEKGSYLKLEEKVRRKQIIRINPREDSIVKDTPVVRVTGFNTIVPINADPDFITKEVAVADNEFVDFSQNTRYEEDPLFRGRTRDTYVPGQPSKYSRYRRVPPGVIRQDFPSSVVMPGPDKIAYEQSPSEIPDLEERDKIHADYAAESESLPEEQTLLHGTIRVSDDADFGQIETILTAVSAAVQAGAAGYGAYAQKRGADRARKDAATAAKADAAQSAALFNQQFGQQYGQQLSQAGPMPAGMPMGPGIQRGPVAAPFSTGSVDWTTVGVIGGSALALFLAVVIIVKA